MIGTIDTLDGMEYAMSSTRQLAGNIVRDEIARAHLTVRSAAAAWRLATSTLAKVTRGDEAVSSITLRHVEGGLGLPTGFLDYVIDGDQKRIERLPGQSPQSPSGLREDLRHYTLEALQDMELPRRRRVGDR